MGGDRLALEADLRQMSKILLEWAVVLEKHQDKKGE